MLFYYTNEFKNCSIIRSNDPDKLEKADLLFDVGGRYNHELKAYDHA